MSKMHPKDEWAESMTQMDMNDRAQWDAQRKDSSHKGYTAATCPACFEDNPSVTRHAGGHEIEAARGHLTSQQFDTMFGGK